MNLAPDGRKKKLIQLRQALYRKFQTV